MKFKKPKVICRNDLTLYQSIEWAGRSAFNSLKEEMNEETAYKFLKKLSDMNHYSPLEFGVVGFIVPQNLIDVDIYIEDSSDFKFINITYNKYREDYFISGNIRAFNNILYGYGIREIFDYFYSELSFLQPNDKNNYDIEANKNAIEEEIKNNKIFTFNPMKAPRFFTINEIKAHQYYNFCIETDRAVSHELVRHRTMSFLQQSQRYVDYRKYGCEIITPEWKEKLLVDNNGKKLWDDFLEITDKIEKWYKQTEDYLTPQEARDLLPTCFSTVINMCGNVETWINFLELRYYERTGKVLPRMKEISTMIYNYILNKESWIE